VEWVTQPPQYTVAASLTVNVTATSNLGVKAVYVSVGSTRTPAAKQGNGTWLAEITLPVVGHNIIAVWAEDSTSPTPNSGENSDVPYRLVADVNYAPTPPSISYDAAFGSYTDERSIQLAVDANGIAKMPAEYTIGPKLPIPPGGDIYKMSTRLSGGTMNAAELESTNNNNIPVLRFTVPHNPNIDPPLETPTYVAHVTCTGCPEYPDQSGSLLVAAAADPQRALFDLPVSSETVPVLAHINGAATVSFTITARSSSSAQTTVPGFNFTFHVIGPPIAIAEDLQYGTNANTDKSATYAYHLGDNTYADLWKTSGFPTSQVRLMRYVITNPTPATIAAQLSYQQASQGSWQAFERWASYGIWEGFYRGFTDPSRLPSCYDRKSFTRDGFTFQEPFCVAAGTALSCWNGSATVSTTSGYVLHKVGDTAHQFTCATVDLTSFLESDLPTQVQSTGDITLELARVAPEYSGQERPPDLDQSGQWVLVPPAVGNSPGTLVVYLRRPAGAPRSQALQWNVNVSTDPSAEFMNHYQSFEYVQYLKRTSPTSGYDYRMGYRRGHYLVSAEDRVYGTLSGRTQPYTTEGGLAGEALSRLSVVLQREPLFAH
jgi:hypothetical protein